MEMHLERGCIDRLILLRQQLLVVVGETVRFHRACVDNTRTTQPFESSEHTL